LSIPKVLLNLLFKTTLQPLKVQNDESGLFKYKYKEKENPIKEKIKIKIFFIFQFSKMVQKLKSLKKLSPKQ
jgi:hypothetical protein